MSAAKLKDFMVPIPFVSRSNDNRLQYRMDITSTRVLIGDHQCVSLSEVWEIQFRTMMMQLCMWYE